MLAEWQDALDGDFSMSLAALQTDPELQRALQGSNYSDPERLNTPCSRSGIDSAANIGSGTADGVFEPARTEGLMLQYLTRLVEMSNIDEAMTATSTHDHG